MEGKRLAIDRESDVTEDIEVEPGCRDDDVRLELNARLQEDALLGERVDLVGDDRCLA